MASFKLTSLPSPKPPKYCTKYFVEFSGKQQKLSAFFTQNSQTSQTSQISTTTTNEIGEKRKLTETVANGQALKRPKNGQQQQRNLLSFFKPQNPPKVEAVTIQSNAAVTIVSNDENPLKVEEFDPEKRVQVIIQNCSYVRLYFYSARYELASSKE
jgi:hypothetical protein